MPSCAEIFYKMTRNTFFLLLLTLMRQKMRCPCSKPATMRIVSPSDRRLTSTECHGGGCRSVLELLSRPVESGEDDRSQTRPPHPPIWTHCPSTLSLMGSIWKDEIKPPNVGVQNLQGFTQEDGGLWWTPSRLLERNQSGNYKAMKHLNWTDNLFPFGCGGQRAA